MMRPTTPRRLLPEHEETKDSAKTHQDIVSKLLEHTGCKIIMIDAQCEVVLTLSPEQRFEILSRDHSSCLLVFCRVWPPTCFLVSNARRPMVWPFANMELPIILRRLSPAVFRN